MAPRVSTRAVDADGLAVRSKRPQPLLAPLAEERTTSDPEGENCFAPSSLSVAQVDDYWPYLGVGFQQAWPEAAATPFSSSSSTACTPGFTPATEWNQQLCSSWQPWVGTNSLNNCSSLPPSFTFQTEYTPSASPSGLSIKEPNPAVAIQSCSVASAGMMPDNPTGQFCSHELPEGTVVRFGTNKRYPCAVTHGMGLSNGIRHPWHAYNGYAASNAQGAWAPRNRPMELCDDAAPRRNSQSSNEWSPGPHTPYNRGMSPSSAYSSDLSINGLSSRDKPTPQ